MSRIIRVQKGGLVAVPIVTREVSNDADNGRRRHPNGATMQLLDAAGAASGSLMSGAFRRRGEFIFYWETSNLALGDYRARIRFGYAFSSLAGGVTKTGERDVILRLVNAQ